MSRIQQLTWSEVADRISAFAPKLTEIINRLDPGKQFPIYKITYHYGQEIVTKGTLLLPTEDKQWLPIHDKSIPTHIKEDLIYNSWASPVGMLLNKSAEMYLSLATRIVPYALCQAGELFGLWGILNPKLSHHPGAIWDMSAGARSIFMLPKISDAIAHNRLRQHFKIQLDPPKQLSEHWQVFKELNAKSESDSPWEMEVLFFSKKWFEHFNDPAWCPLKRYLFEMAWEETAFLRNSPFWNLIYSVIEERQTLPPNGYISDIVKHLFRLSVGAIPGFAPAINDNAAPIKQLQSIYANDVYMLKQYAPIIMTPAYFTMANKQSGPVYFSTHFHSALEFSEKNNKRPSMPAELEKIKFYLDKYQEELTNGYLDVSATPIGKAANELAYNFYYYDANKYESLRESNTLPQYDKRFDKLAIKTKNKTFPASSPFVRGCIQVMHV